MSNQDIEECKKIIKEFLKLEDKHIDYIKTFEFNRLREEEKYKGRSPYGKFRACKDEDNFYIVKCIYYLLWNKSLPKMSNFTEMENYYGGETINPIKNSSLYLTIGNFMLLPKILTNNHISLNTYKYSCFRDDMQKMLKKMQDLFYFYKYKKWQKYDQYNITWQELAEKNNFYFEGLKTYENFLAVNFLEDFEDYKNTDNFEKIIKLRSNKMVNKLKEAVETKL